MATIMKGVVIMVIMMVTMMSTVLVMIAITMKIRMVMICGDHLTKHNKLNYFFIPSMENLHAYPRETSDKE